MASITIRNLDDSTKARLRIRAAEHGRSMEAEVREILNAAAQESLALPAHPVDRIRAFVEKHGGFSFELPPRELINDPPDFR